MDTDEEDRDGFGKNFTSWNNLDQYSAFRVAFLNEILLAN